MDYLSKRQLSLLAVACLLLALYPACSNPTPPPAAAAFDRPEDVAFFCFDLQDEVVVPLATVGGAASPCTPAIPETVEDDRGNPADDRYALHALVTQTTTGEVAAVRLTGTEGAPPGVIDTDVRIPGFTFAAVGAVPSALAVSLVDPQQFFVLSRGSAQIHSVDTLEMRKGRGVEARATSLVVPERSLPSAMLLAPDQGSLLITLPETGQVGRIAIDSTGNLNGTPELLDLSTVVPAAVDLTAVPVNERPGDYFYGCNAPALFAPPVVPPRDPVMLGTTPSPVSMIIDPETDELLVADRALPMIHIIDPVTLTETGQIATGVPVNRLALTPRVPTTDGSTDATERFLYAIDETDGSVLAIDYSDPARGSFGAVLSVEVAIPNDRIDTPFPARTLAVVSPRYDPASITYCTDGGDGDLASGISLHGVFLAVGTVDGRIRFFDVFDQDTTCRGFDCVEMRVNPDADDQIVTIGRHRPRLGSFRDTGVSVDQAPSWETDGVGVELVDEAGATNAPELVPLLRALTCDEPLDAIFPLDSTSPRVCAIRDPWAARSQTFSASYEGPIPFTATTGANLEPGGVLLAQTDFCRVGVMGSENRPAMGYLAGYGGDIVAITGDLPPSILMGDESTLSRCSSLTQRTIGGEITPVLLPITLSESHPDGVHESYVGRLTLGDPMGPGGFTLSDVETCYPELLQIEVRTRDSFVVQGGLTSFTHPIVEAADHRCVVDPDRAAVPMRGRAFFDDTFRSPEVTFAFGPRPSDIEGRNPRLEIPIVNVPTPLTIDVSSISGASSASLLTRLVYNEVDERLYAVDQSVVGLLRIRLSQLTVQQTFR